MRKQLKGWMFAVVFLGLIAIYYVVRDPTQRDIPAPPVHPPAGTADLLITKSDAPVAKPIVSIKARADDIRVDSDSIVFINGKYIEFPYRFERREFTLTLNGVMIERIDWPGKNYVEVDPPVPTGLTRDSSFADLERGFPVGNSWINLKTRYLCSHFSPEEAHTRTLEAWKSLPFVASAEVVRNQDKYGIEMLQVVTHRGERREWLADDLDLRPRSKEKVIEELRITAEDYSDILKRPTFLFRVQYGELSFASGQPEWDHLPEILELLKTDLPRDKKRRQLTQWVSEEFSEMLTATPVISDHPQLDARLTRIRTERKAE